MMEQTIQDSNAAKVNNSKGANKQDLEDSLDLFGESKDDFNIDNETTYEVNIPKETTDKILKVSRMVKVALLTIQGYEEQPSGETNSSMFKLVKHPLASSEVIKAFQGLLEPYADESNLVTKKKWDSFKVQAFADWGAFYKLMLREKASPEDKERAVQRIFQDCLINIGEITCDNPGNIGKIFGTMNEKQNQEEQRRVFSNV